MDNLVGPTMDLRQHPDICEFRAAAQRFCNLLESPPADANAWAESVLAALARLYACAYALPETSTTEGAPEIDEMYEVGDEEWRRVFDLVHQVLGVQAVYWSYFDPSESPGAKYEPTFGDLGDDLADIYRDLKPGLRAWDAGFEQYLADIVFYWKEALFVSHWGVHAVSAMHVLHRSALLRGIKDRR